MCCYFYVPQFCSERVVAVPSDPTPSKETFRKADRDVHIGATSISGKGRLGLNRDDLLGGTQLFESAPIFNLISSNWFSIVAGITVNRSLR